MSGSDPFTGVGVETPREGASRYGLGALTRRIGARPNFLASMLATLDGEDVGLRTDDVADPSIALLDAAATMLDIVTRYTEAAAQEAYLDTATDRGALIGLAALTGAQLAAGRAAETQLSFMVARPVGGGVPGDMPETVIIPAGTRVQSIPLPGERPVTYRTAADFEARGERNAVPLARYERTADFTNAAQYRFAAMPAGLAAGSTVLVGSRVATVTALFADEAGGGVVTLDPAGSAAVTWPARPLTAFAPPSGEVTGAMIASLLASRVRQGQIDQAGADRRWDMQALAAALGAGARGADMAAGAVLTVLGTGAALFGHNGPDVAVAGSDGKLTTRSGVSASTRISDQAAGALALYLEGNVASARQGAAILLREGSTNVLGAIAAAKGRSASGFNLHQRVTHVTLASGANDAALQAMTLQGTEVLLESARAFTLPPELPPSLAATETRIVLEGAFFGLREGATAVVTGLRAEGDGSEVAIARTIADVELDGGRTVLVLDGGLGVPLLRASVRVSLNVARAVQGEFVSEVLGSGDASRSWQRFHLKQGPLTWVAGTVGQSLVAPDIEVRVGGIRWDRRETFLGAGPDDRIWVLETTIGGQAAVTFGDGVTGARLPTGTENVAARYGKGIGTGGNVRPGQLTLLLDRPLGVTGVTNPLASGGGADPEHLEDARRVLPAHMRAMGRAVTLRDYADLALNIPGLGETRADWVWDGHRRVAAVTAVGAGGSLLDSRTFALVASSLASSGEEGAAVALLAHRPRSFAVAASLALDSAYEPRMVLDAAAAALSAAFGFGARRLAQPVYPSEVVAVLQGIPGVTNVDLDALWALDGASPAAGTQPQAVLAAGARLNGSGGLQGADLLLIEPNPGRRLMAR